MRGVYSASRAEGAEPARLSEPVQQARVFVGLMIAPEIAIKLTRFAAVLEQPFVRPVAQADIHLTLVPPWNENFIPGAIDKLRRVAEEFHPFWLLFQHVGYGPDRHDHACFGRTVQPPMTFPPCVQRFCESSRRPTNARFSPT